MKNSLMSNIIFALFPNFNYIIFLQNPVLIVPVSQIFNR